MRTGWGLRPHGEPSCHLIQIFEMLAIVAKVDAKVIPDCDATERSMLACARELFRGERARKVDQAVAAFVERPYGRSEFTVAEVPAFVVVEVELRLCVRRDLADPDEDAFDLARLQMRGDLAERPVLSVRPVVRMVCH